MQLRLHRMLSAKAGTLGFERPKDFDFERFAAEARHDYGRGEYARLSFTIDARDGAFLRETPLSKDQVLVVDGDTFHVTATVPDSRKLHRWVLSRSDVLRDVKKEPLGKRPGKAGGTGVA